MKKIYSFLLTILLLHFSYASSHSKVESAPRIDKESWEIDDAALKKTAVTMLVFGAVFSAITFVLCAFIPSKAGDVETSSGSSTEKAT